jgi:hypothetical protein
MSEVLSGCAIRAALQRERLACQSRAAFEEYIRELRRPDIGDEADELTEADFVCDLAEDGWPDYDKWLTIWCRLNDGGELTPREREQALHYYGTDDGDTIPPEHRLAPTPTHEEER